MLILTQWQNKVVNLDKVETIFVEQAGKRGKYYIFARGTSGKNEVLGQYEDEARAKEVLWKIGSEHMMMPHDAVYVMPDA